MIKSLKTYRTLIAIVGVLLSLLSYIYEVHDINNKRFKEIIKLKKEIEITKTIKEFEISRLEFERDTIRAKNKLISKKLKSTLKIDRTDEEVRVIDGVYSF